jgi:hypothetical protein
MSLGQQCLAIIILPSEEINGILGVTGQSIFTVNLMNWNPSANELSRDCFSGCECLFAESCVRYCSSERTPVIMWQQGDGDTRGSTKRCGIPSAWFAGGLVPVIAVDEPPAGIASPDDLFSPPPYMQKELVDAILALSPLVPAGTTMTFDSANGLVGKTHAVGKPILARAHMTCL